MNITDIDIKLLTMFVAVVDAQGISNAQNLLGKDASTISKNIAQLETRLGFKLCDRGRSGFETTDEGKKVYQSALQLFRSLKDFEIEVATIKNALSGPIRLSIIDNLITDPQCPLIELFSRYAARKNNEVELFIDVASPNLIENALINKQSDIGIGIFENPIDELVYINLYQEQDHLYSAAECAEDHLELLAHGNTNKLVTRTFLRNEQQSAQLNTQAWVENIEAAAMLILAGSHIGFLPDHYAKLWVDQGRLVTIEPESYFRTSMIQLAYCKSRTNFRPAVQGLLDDLLSII